MFQRLTYENLNEQMVVAIPTLRTDHERECAWWDNEPAPAHVIFGEVLNPYLSGRLLESDNEALKIVFDFLEHMAGDIDPRVQDVLRDTVLEHLRDEPLPLREHAESVMGSKTLVHWRAVTGTV